MQPRIVLWSGWIAFLVLMAGVFGTHVELLDIPAFLTWLHENEGAAAWVSVLATVAAIFGAAWFSFDLFRHQQDRLAADRMTAIYIVASAAGREVVHYDRLQRDAAVDVDQRKEDASSRKRVAARWDAWIVNRLKGLADAIDAYQATGIEPKDFMQDLLTVQGRLRWLAGGVGQRAAARQLSAGDAELLEEAAYESVRYLLRMRSAVDQVRTQARLASLEPQGIKVGSPGPLVEHDSFRQSQWADARKI